MSREEFLRETGLTFKPVCADRTFTYACFECLGVSGQAPEWSPTVVYEDVSTITQGAS